MESNYLLDSRTVAQMTPRRRSPGVDSSGNPIVIVHFFTEDEQGEEVECHDVFIAQFVVCPMCRGKAKVTDPRVDSCGLTADDLHDHNFAEDYFSGVYDITSPECSGERVVKEIDARSLTPGQRVVLDKLERLEEEDARFAKVCAAERAYGC